MTGTTVGHYRVVRKLGEGGMGEVYRAHDTQLKRDVALKVLPSDVSLDPERLERFDREAQALAALNHPHIAQVYGVAQERDVRAIVMELVDGPTLAERLAHGPIPLDEALPLTRQLAEALEYAHEHGIVHRDLKPANIKVRPDGELKVLDFGLAKVLAGEPSGAGADVLGNSPTMTSPARLRGAATQAGVILGTAAYMSPEQARGAVVDKRADIWAFGVVLFEMLSGKPCFPGETVTDVLAAVVKSEPDWNALPTSTPPRLRELLERCLTKDRRQRVHDIGDARIDLERVVAAPASAVEHRSSTGSSRVAWIVAAVSVAALAVVVVFVPGASGSRGKPADPGVVRFHITPPTGFRIPVRPRAASISPDAKAVAYVAEDDRQSALWIRTLKGTDGDAWRVPGSDGAVTAPFWKPDGSEFAFAVPGGLRSVNIESRTLTPICSLPAATDPDVDGAWSGEGQVVFGVSGTESNFSGQLWQCRPRVESRHLSTTPLVTTGRTGPTRSFSAMAGSW